MKSKKKKRLTLVTFVIGSQGEARKTLTSSISALSILWAFTITILWNTKFIKCDSFSWDQMIMLMSIMIVLSLSLSLKSGFSNYCRITNTKLTTTTNHRDKTKQGIGKIKIPSLPVLFSKRGKNDTSKVRLKPNRVLEKSKFLAYLYFSQSAGKMTRARCD